MTVASLVNNEWGPLRPITFQQSPALRRLARSPKAQEDAHVYFGAVNENPSVPGTLLGLFPTALKTAASILMAVSCDGSHFSAPIRLFESSHVGGEIVITPSTGFVDGDDVLLYVHAGVPGVFEKTCAFKALHPEARGQKAQCHGELEGVMGRLIGLAIHREKLATGRANKRGASRGATSRAGGVILDLVVNRRRSHAVSCGAAVTPSSRRGIAHTFIIALRAVASSWSHAVERRALPQGTSEHGGRPEVGVLHAAEQTHTT